MCVTEIHIGDVGNQITGSLSLLMDQTAVQQLCAQVWENVCVRRQEKGSVCVCVSEKEREIEKQRCNLCCTSDPTDLGCRCLYWGLLTWEKRQHIRNQLPPAQERKEVGVTRGWRNMIEMFVFTCTWTADYHERERNGIQTQTDVSKWLHGITNSSLYNSWWLRNLTTTPIEFFLGAFKWFPHHVGFDSKLLTHLENHRWQKQCHR